MQELTERINALEIETEHLNFVLYNTQRRSKSQTNKIETDIASMKADIADIKANNIEIRNLLAKLVQKLG